MRPYLVALALIAGCAEPAKVAEKPRVEKVEARPKPEPRAEIPRRPFGTVDIEAEDQDVRELLADVGRQVGRNIVILGETDTRVTLTLRAAPWREVVAYVSKLAKLDPAGERGTVLTLKARPRNTLLAQRAHAGSWFLMLAQQSGKSIIMPRITGEIDCELHDVPPEVALAATAADLGYTVLDADGAIVVGGKVEGR